MKTLFGGIAAIAMSMHAFAQAPASYTIIDLGAGFSPIAVNSHGQLVGTSANGPATYLDGAWQLLPMSKSPPIGYAAAINDRGVIAGSDNGQPTEWIHLFRKPMANARRNAAVAAIADDDTVLGDYFGGSFNYCYTWKAGTSVNFYPLAGTNCHGHALSPTSGYIGGDDQNDNGDQHAFIIGPNGATDLGTLTGSGESTVVALNKRGHAAVASSYDDSGALGAAYWNGHKLVNLGLHANGAQSQATAINGHDNVLAVGQDHQGHVLFLYAGQTKTMTPIEPLIANPEGWTFDYAAPGAMLAAIAPDGTIYGTANLNGEAHAFMLQPSTD